MQKNRSIHSVILAAALVAAATLSSCTNEDNAVVENPSDNEVLFTATLAPRGDDGATRAVYSSGKTYWKKDEKIAIYYETTEVKDGSPVFATAVATVGKRADDGSAPFTVTLTDPKEGGAVKLVYPATLHNGAGDIDETALLKQQGILTDDNASTKDISHYFDAATATATLDVDNATFSSPITMQNRVCICKFSFTGLQPGDDENMYDIYITVTEGGTSMTYKISDVTPATISAVYVAMLPTENADVDFKVEGFYSIGGGVSPDAHKNIYTKSVSGVKLVAGNFYTNASIAVVYDNYLTGNITSTVTVPAGKTLYLKNANINVISSGPGILCKGDATIVLEGVNTVTTTADGQAGIQAGNSLIISGSGSLTAKCVNGGAGIGTSVKGTCGAITISGGTITAIGGDDGAGIGASNRGNCGDISIIGGTVEATGGSSAAGIGAGDDATCGAITISGGTVTATGGSYAAGIGAGGWGLCSAITIYGDNTHIKATKGDDAPYSIGLGYDSTCGTVTIGGTVYYNGRSFENGGATYLAQSPFYWQWSTTTP